MRSGERTAGESEAGAGGASAKDTERAAGVFMAAVRVAAAILIRMGGIVRRTECSSARPISLLAKTSVEPRKGDDYGEGTSPWCCEV